jgi:hypothetical protein
MLNAPLLSAAVDAFRIPDLNALQRVFQTNQLAGFFDLFSGSALSSLSVAALGVYPYITTQIIMQIMQPATPAHMSSYSWVFALSNAGGFPPPVGRPSLTGADRPTPARPRSGRYSPYSCSWHPSTV